MNLVVGEEVELVSFLASSASFGFAFGEKSLDPFVVVAF